jgi:hypothetical protein
MTGVYTVIKVKQEDMVSRYSERSAQIRIWWRFVM